MSYAIDGMYHRNISMVGAMGATAKVSITGRSQAVRLPRELRFESDEIRFRKVGSAVILGPVPRDW